MEIFHIKHLQVKYLVMPGTETLKCVSKPMLKDSITFNPPCDKDI